MIRDQEEGCVLCRTHLLTPTIRETDHWRIVINRNQSLLGKLFIALRRHEASVAGLTSEEWEDLHRELVWATDRLRRAFAPDHFNYAFLQNQDRHVHLHVIPRYSTPRRFAGLEFADPDYPGHYRPGVEKLGDSDMIAAIERALTS